SRLFKRLKIVDGQPLKRGDRQKAVIGKVLAANTGKKPGDKLEMYGEEIEVVGVFDSRSVFESGSVVLPITELQRLMNTSLVTAFSISVEHPEDPQFVAEVQR